MSRSPTSVHTNSEMESEINRLHNFCAENNTISMLKISIYGKRQQHSSSYIMYSQTHIPIIFSYYFTILYNLLIIKLRLATSS